MEAKKAISSKLYKVSPVKLKEDDDPNQYKSYSIKSPQARSSAHKSTKSTNYMESGMKLLLMSPDDNSHSGGETS